MGKSERSPVNEVNSHTKSFKIFVRFFNGISFNKRPFRETIAEKTLRFGQVSHSWSHFMVSLMAF